MRNRKNDLASLIIGVLTVLIGSFFIVKAINPESTLSDLGTLGIVTLILAVILIYLQSENIKRKILIPIIKFVDPYQNYFPIISGVILLVIVLIIWIIIKPNADDLKRLGPLEDTIAFFNLSISFIMILLIYSIGLRYRDILVKNSTLYVGTFPNNMKEIISLIDSTEKELFLAIDFPSYGCYSDPSLNEEYKNSLRKLVKNKKVNLKMVVYNSEKAKEASSEQFEGAYWSFFENSHQLGVFNEFHGGRENPSDFNELIKLFLELDSEFVKSLKSIGFEGFKLTNKDLPAYIWISDNDKAIFSFYNLQGIHSEVSFFTKDRNLIKVLKTIFVQVFTEGKSH